MDVKICGVCTPHDAAIAVRNGAAYVGVILAPARRRTQTPESASRIFAQAGSAKRVGVFVNPTERLTEQLVSALELGVIQLHGQEDPSVVATIKSGTGCEVWKTIWLEGSSDLRNAIDHYGDHVDGFLLDAMNDGQIGGTGVPFDWRLAAHARSQLPARLKLIVAGGLTPENVRMAIEIMSPDVVDVATGVELSPGRKSEAAIAAFVRNARL